MTVFVAEYISLFFTFRDYCCQFNMRSNFYVLVVMVKHFC